MMSEAQSPEPELALGLPMSAQVTDRRALEVLVDTIPDAMIIIDESGVIVAYSPKAERMFGYTLDEVRGENVSILMPSPDREHHDGYILNYMKTGEHKIIGLGRIVNGRRKDGTVFPLHLCVGDARTDHQIIFVGYMHDLSRRAEIKAKLLSLQAEMSHVGRVTQAGTLATAIAHELNQPLTAICNYVEAALTELHQDHADFGRAKDAMSHCAHEIQRAGEILRNWRSFLRSGLREREFVSIKHLIEASLSLALADGGGKGVHLSQHIEACLPLAFAGNVEIQQVLVNLFRNALDATRGQKSRMIVIGAQLSDDEMIEVAISDNGPGLEAGIAERLFEPFKTTKSDGMGLGLSISHTIIEAHGGRIWAEPSEFGGTTFRFTIPTRKEDIL